LHTVGCDSQSTTVASRVDVGLDKNICSFRYRSSMCSSIDSIFDRHCESRSNEDAPVGKTSVNPTSLPPFPTAASWVESHARCQDAKSTEALTFSVKGNDARSNVAVECATEEETLADRAAGCWKDFIASLHDRCNMTHKGGRGHSLFSLALCAGLVRFTVGCVCACCLRRLAHFSATSCLASPRREEISWDTVELALTFSMLEP
jgi:hypothetical protein